MPILRFRTRSVSALTFAITLTVLLTSPLSFFLQTSSFSLSHLDSSEGDQAVQSLDVSPNRDVSIQIFGTDIQAANALSARFEYNATHVVYTGFDVGGVLPDPFVNPEESTNPTFVEINIASLDGGSAMVNSGLIGTLRFRTTDAFWGTTIRLVRAALSRGEKFESMTLTGNVALQVFTAPSPDFDGSGMVDSDDFLMFIGHFGTSRGDEAYWDRFDLDGNGKIGISDFLILTDNFGRAVPVAVGAIDPVTLGNDPVTVDVSGNFSDVAALRYTAVSNADSVATASVDGSEVTIHPVTVGVATITVTATDADGLRAMQDITVTVRFALAFATSTTRRALDENTPPGEQIGEPVAVRGFNSLTYRLKGTDADSFAIDARTGQIQSREGISYDFETKNSYWMTVEANDGQGGTASIVVIIKINDVKEPPSLPPSNFLVIPDNESLTVHFSAVSDEEGRPPVRGYHAEIRRGENGPWGTRKTIYGRTNTSVYYHHIDPEGYHSRILINGQLYQVRIRAYNSEGASEWSVPVSGVPVYVPPKEEPQLAQFQGEGDMASADIDLSFSTDEGGRIKVMQAALPATISQEEVEGVFVEVVEVEISNAPDVPVHSGFTLPDISSLFDIELKARVNNRDVAIGDGLQTSVEICLPVHENISDPVIVYYDEGTSAWEMLDRQRVAGDEVCGHTDMFSLFGVGESINRVPEVMGTLEAQTLKVGDAGVTIDISGKFSDPDGDALTYAAVSSDEAIAKVDVSGSVVTITPIAEGRATITVTARDVAGLNQTAEQTISVTVNKADEKLNFDGATVLAQIYTVGTQIDDLRLPEAAGGSDAIGYTLTPGLPEGLVLDLGTRTISGTPKVAIETREYKWQAMDADENTIELIFFITVEPSNQAPRFASGSTFNVLENTKAVGTVVAEDTDIGDSITGYGIVAGADGSQFSIVASTGVLNFNVPPNYEAPADVEFTDATNSANNNVAGNNEYTVIVTATSGESTRELTVCDTLTVTVADVNEAPGRPAAPTVSASTVNSLTVDWVAPANTGPEITDYDVQYRVGNNGEFTDAEYDGTGLTTTLIDLPENTSYEIQVRAKNNEGTGVWSESGSGMTVANQAPTFSSGATFDIAENSTSVGIVTATDADVEDSITGYTLTGGVDHAQFAIVKETGVLTFKTAPNYEVPTDVESMTPSNAVGNNEYVVVVTASSGTDVRVKTATQMMTITVTDVDTEAPGRPDAPSVAQATLNSLKVQWSAPTNTGPEISSYDVRYILSSASDEDKADATKWTLQTDAWTNGSLEYTIGSLNQNTGYYVQVRAKSDEGTGPWSDSVTGTTSANSTPIANDKIYWSDNSTDKIQRSNLDGSNVEDLITRSTLRAPVGIALDISGGKIYWIDESTDKIQRASIELEQDETTRTVEDLITTGLTAPSGIALDISGGKMYWVDRGTDKIQRSNLDGSNVEDLVTTGLTAPSGIALDISGGKMYWVDRGTDKIQRANLDGSNVEDLVTTGLTAPSGIALDISGGKMYWVDNGTDKIQRTSIELGQGETTRTVEDLVTGVADPRGIALDISGGKMYWVDNGADKIQRANLDGSNVEDVITTGLTTPVSIALDVISGQILTMGTSGTVDVSGYFTDPDDDGLMYSVSSSDTGIATVSVVGSVVTISPMSSGRATVTVTASDGHLSVQQTFTVTVIETIKENNAPVFTSMSSFSMSENSTVSVATVSATDADSDDSITGYGIVDDADGAQFSIVAATGVLTFKVAPNYESPTDVEFTDATNSANNNAADNNEYIVMVTATSGADARALTSRDTLTVTVTDVNEAPGKPDAPSVSDATLNSLKVQWSAPTNMGPEVSAYDIRSILSSASDEDKADDSKWTETADAWTSGSLEYTIGSLNQNTGYYVQVRAKSDEGTGPWSDSVTGTTSANSTPIANDKIYWSDNSTDKIQRSNLDGSNVEDLITRSTLRAPVGIALDISGGKIYWIDESTDKIQRASIELEQDETTRTVEDLITTGLTAPSGIALDISGGKMYWVDRGTDKIQRSNLDGSNVEDLVTTGLTAPSGIALDISGGKMYWVDRGTDKIQRANLDGSNVEDLVTTGLTAPSGIALDISGGKMYWVDNGTDKIQRTSIELGQGETTRTVEDLVTGVADPRGIALDISGGKMYWVDNGADKIQRANLDGSNVEDVITTGLTTPVSIALDF